MLANLENAQPDKTDRYFSYYIGLGKKGVIGVEGDEVPEKGDTFRVF